MNDSKSELEMICEFSQASLLEIIKFQENEYIKTHKNHPDWNQKYYTLKQLKMDLYSKNVISEEDIIILKEFAMSKGGFLTNEIRKDLWMKILCVGKTKEEKRKYELIYINENFNKEEEKGEIFVKKEEPFEISKR
jgi:hypothetical protein